MAKKQELIEAAVALLEKNGYRVTPPLNEAAVKREVVQIHEYDAFLPHFTADEYLADGWSRQTLELAGVLPRSTFSESAPAGAHPHKKRTALKAIDVRAAKNDVLKRWGMLRGGYSPADTWPDHQPPKETAHTRVYERWFPGRARQNRKK